MFDEAALDEQWKRNNIHETNKIIDILNSKTYNDYLELSVNLRSLVEEFDPFSKESVIEYIFKNLRPEHQSMFSPVRIVMQQGRNLHRRRRRLFGCFSQT